MATGYGLDGQGLITGKGKIFFAPHTVWRSTLSPEVNRPGAELIIHLRLVPRSRMVERYIHPHHMPSWLGA
jgi:hypothetical protein